MAKGAHGSPKSQWFGRTWGGLVAPCWGPVQAARSHGVLELLLLGFHGTPSPPHCSQLGLGVLTREFLSLSFPPDTAKGGHRAHTGSRHSTDRAPHGSINHSPHLLCLEALPGDSPVPSMSVFTPAWGESQEPSGERTPSHHTLLCIMQIQRNNLWPSGFFHPLRY